MSKTGQSGIAADRRLRWSLGLTRWGMAAERLLRAFWPFGTLLMAGLSAMLSGADSYLAVEVWWISAIGLFVGLTYSMMSGLRRFRWPGLAEASARLDASLPGRPIAALADHQAVGRGDPASEALWQAHLSRMRARLAAVRPVAPDLRLASRDRYGLRFMALLCLVMTVIFGAGLRLALPGQPGPGAALAAGPSWEGWIEPPAYTGKPTLYLADQKGDRLVVPAGSFLSLRLYGQVGTLIVSETVSGRTGTVQGASDATQSFDITRDGTLRIDGPGGAAWQVSVLPDAAPKIGMTGQLRRDLSGEMRQPFAASDDYGVVAGHAVIALDLAAVPRRYGLAAEPDPREPVTVDLPMTLAGNRADFTETLIEDFSGNPWVDLPVTLTLYARDAAGHETASEPAHLLLPGRRFLDPLAAVLVEQRRDLLWSRSNGSRVAQILRAVSFAPADAPAGVLEPGSAYLRLRVAIRRLEAGLDEGLTAERQQEVAQALWDIAVTIEEGTLSDALARLRQAQQRLSEAMRQGASDDEIAQLTEEMRQAMQDYMNQLKPGESRQAQSGGQTREVTQDMLNRMLDEVQRLMREGKTAEAQQLLDQLGQLMQNLQAANNSGQGGQGQPGQGAMQGMSDALRGQQDLSDETFGQLQDQLGGGPSGRRGMQGQGGDQGQSGGGDAEALADRQRGLQDKLGELGRQMPGGGGETGDSARKSLEDARKAMRDAEEALRNNDLAGALNGQAQAMEALRQGLRDLGTMLSQNAQPGDGGQPGRQQSSNGLDPLGREPGMAGSDGTDQNLLGGEDVYRRARDLLDEIRNRSSDPSRPLPELDYLRRLLERF